MDQQAINALRMTANGIAVPVEESTQPRRMRLGHDQHRQTQPVQHTQGVVAREGSVGSGSGRDIGARPQSKKVSVEAVRPIFHDGEITRCNADGLPLMPFDGLLHPVPPVPTYFAGYVDTASLGLRRRDILIKFLPELLIKTRRALSGLN